MQQGDCGYLWSSLSARARGVRCPPAPAQSAQPERTLCSAPLQQPACRPSQGDSGQSAEGVYHWQTQTWRQPVVLSSQGAGAGAHGWCAWVAERSGRRSHSTLAAPPASFPASPAGPLLPRPAVPPQGTKVVSREQCQRPAALHRRGGKSCTENIIRLMTSSIYQTLEIY